MSATNGIDPTVTVENEKQTITIGNSVAAVEKPTITREKEKAIIDEIERHCRYWRKVANAYIIAIIFFGISAVSTSVLVSIYTGSPEAMMSVATIKILACVSTVSLAILTAFNLVANGGNAKNAWRSLNAALMMYTAGSISIQQLIEQYQQGEGKMGNLSFNYGTNSDKPATYSHDISAAEEVRKSKEAEDPAKNIKDAEAAKKNGIADAEKLLEMQRLQNE